MTEHRMDRLSALLAMTDAPPRAIAFPAARIARAHQAHRVMRWRVAAVLALLLGAAALHEPLRAWVVARAQGLWRAVAGTHVAAPPPAPSAAPARDGAPGAVAFAPAAGTFRLRVRTRQAAGTLGIVFVTDDSLVHAASLGGLAGEWLVRPDGLELLNDRHGRASVVLTVPVAVDRVLVAIGGAAPVPVSRDTTFTLGSGAR